MRVKLVLVSFFAFYVAAAAQKPVQQASLNVDRPLSVEVDRVNVLFTVSSRGGRFITTLRERDFQVFENDQPHNITNFSTETDLPLSIALLIDTSGSLRGRMRFEREAASNFFYSVLRRGQDKALILGFDHAITTLQNYTDDPSVLEASVQKVISGGSTSLYDAVGAAAHRLAGQPGRRVIIILSDGMDNSSHVSLADTMEIAQKNDVTIYAVSTNLGEAEPSPERLQGDANLTRLATETGGIAWFLGIRKDLNHSFQKISLKLRSKSSLAYRPNNAKRDGTYRQIRILSSHKNYNFRWRAGYFAN